MKKGGEEVVKGGREEVVKEGEERCLIFIMLDRASNVHHALSLVLQRIYFRSSTKYCSAKNAYIVSIFENFPN